MNQVFSQQRYSFNDGSQNFSIFQPILDTFTLVGLTGTILALAMQRLLNEKIKPPTTLNKSLSPKLKQHNSKMRLEFKGCCLKVTFKAK